jgi:hypothetical protein
VIGRTSVGAGTCLARVNVEYEIRLAFGSADVHLHAPLLEVAKGLF